jgi:hypothetical protein
MPGPSTEPTLTPTVPFELKQQCATNTERFLARVRADAEMAKLDR